MMGRDLNAHQRAGMVILWLYLGARLSNKDVARLCYMTPQGAGKMMATLSAALPIIHHEGEWQWMEKEK